MSKSDQQLLLWFTIATVSLWLGGILHPGFEPDDGYTVRRRPPR